MEGTKQIPRIIWLLWYQGLSDAPFIVKMCVESWIKENPGWKIIILDKGNIGEYIDLDLQCKNLADLSLTKQSNLARLKLLSKYGGVWADATTFCMMPLDDWIYEHTTSGFFAFKKPGPDRILSTWFLACEKGCPIIPKWKKCYLSFFKKITLILKENSNKNSCRYCVNYSIRVTKQPGIGFHH